MRAIGVLAHRQEVGQHLGWMPFISKTVEYRHTGIGCKRFDIRLCAAPVFDAIEKPTQHLGSVRDRFLMTEL